MTIAAEKIIETIFDDIEFDNVDDPYTINIKHDPISQSLTLIFLNQTTKQEYQQTFYKEDIDEITENYPLSPHDVTTMINNILNNNESIANLTRIYLSPDIKSTMDKYEELVSSLEKPEPTKICSDYEPDGVDTQLLFIISRLHCIDGLIGFVNYCFILPESEISDYDKLKMRIEDLENVNEILQEQMVEITQIMASHIANLTKEVDALKLRLDFDEGEQIDLSDLDFDVTNDIEGEGTIIDSIDYLTRDVCPGNIIMEDDEFL
mmetsp:Transcript_20971/g.18488  ORF Transcript_20971/g.18488 Transcript_20971/m.18488 type:complete len:264 (-) Transcript_20971:37-828(-)|eukprot:CAMPEP_0201581196 /NCGR_PEP_ID=MMETSP0190_2-20130828/64532_1 /ASSEMBLY_ACC=CAM_ASM_000263 /TAXON_ID=37353 /ORGANISM="Rosalina sp." /LENGTH=263 /DNA_ID=CAMNT_0048018649 /DNA_START=17 /DNA_END=808 /DNA_ORIENTATION=+